MPGMVARMTAQRDDCANKRTKRMAIAANPAPKPIGVVQGADSIVIRHLLADFHARWQQRAKIVGVIERAIAADGNPAGQRQRLLDHLYNLAGGRSFPIFQNLGAGSTGCALDGASLVEAGEQVRRDIAAGGDLVILSKFGKFEAENGSGLLPAFVAAIEAERPILTSVAPKFMPAWNNFANPFYVIVPANPQAIDAWWAQAGADLPPCG